MVPLRRAVSLLSLLLSSIPALAAAAGAPVVFALDSSRSLSPAECKVATDLAADLARRLAPDRPVGALSFDDQVRWLVEPGAGRGAPGLAAALTGVFPRGNFTLLDDALVEAAQRLPAGGVVVLVTDGKDESSATTLEDATRLAATAGVRIAAVGAGQPDERVLRRLALLTHGAFLGRLGALDPGAAASEIERLAGAVDATQRAAAPPPTPTPTALPTPAPPPPARGGEWGTLLLALLFAAAAALLGFLSARRRGAPAAAEPAAPEPCPRCGEPLPTDGSPCPRCRDAALAARLHSVPLASLSDLAPVSLDDTSGFPDLPFEEAVEKTFVLTEEPVLIAREPGREPRVFRLPTERAVGIGRLARNTLACADPTLSGEHLRIVPYEGDFYALDLHSTNGLFVNGARVTFIKLRPGDQIKAGQQELELKIRQRSTNW